MKSIIIRKPKFMRSDAAMKAYMVCAESISRTLATQKDLTSDELYEYMKKLGECINDAAKAGGFLRTKDFLTWMEMHKTIA